NAIAPAVIKTKFAEALYEGREAEAAAAYPLGAHLCAAPLLLLDEATCHTDPVAEATAEHALRSRSGTVVVVAHRLSSALRADRVLVLDGTRAQHGTHRELLGTSALYRDLVGHWNDAHG
ncbi:hypothetical protein AB0957_35515, partial [Streptomyces zhihengii]